MSAKRSFLAELQRRNVHRAAIFYGGSAWLLVQIATQVFPFFDISNGTVRLVVIAVAIGFPFAMAFSWRYEWTPQGIKRESEIDHSESIAQQTGKQLDKAIIAVLGLAVVLLLASQFAGRKDGTGATKAALVSATGNAIPAKSIAVLPFTDLSPGHDQEYFSDGMAEELLDALAKVQDLKVAGRTSSFSFKGRNEDLRDIGKTLGVANLLEGSVRKQGDRVRITAQLIQTKDGFHIWSESYDGSLADVFELQERIAHAITDALQVVLAGGQKQRLVTVTTANPDAYSLYLQATAIFNRRDSWHYRDAVANLEEAIRLDPKYARAYSKLAAFYLLLPSVSGVDMQLAQDRIEQYTRTASELAPDLAEPWAVQAQGYGKFPGRLVEQRKAFEHALALDADDVTANFWYGLSLLRTGYRAQGIERLDRTLNLDASLPNGLRVRGIAEFYAGHLDRAEQLLKRARDLGNPLADLYLADVAHARGDDAEAVRLWIAAARAGFPRLSPESSAVIAAGIYGDAAARARAIKLMDPDLTKPSPYIDGTGLFVLAKLGEPARALSLMHTHIANDATDFLILLWAPQGRAMRQLPEFGAFLRDLGFAALWDEYGAPDICRRQTPGNYLCD